MGDLTLSKNSTRRTLRNRRRQLLAISAAACAAFATTQAQAAPASGSASGQLSTEGASAGGTQTNSGGYQWPEVVVAGNAVSFLAPLQFGIVNYLPKARFAFQYDRQIRKGHWFHVGIGMLFDRGNYKNFRMANCGFGPTVTGVCDKGGVVGVDVYAGYTYRFFLRKRPWLVPYIRGTVGYTFFALPKVGGGDGNREQIRTKSQGLSVRPGGGLRVFPLDQLGVGVDVGLPIGFLVHTVRPDGGGKGREGAFLLGIEVLPLVVEYRF